ncbi:MAG TPA: polysaccharide pyruvyl transferase family protein, partial [Anaerolineaceae bacterium]|nr:polysaccharide pyruvyl transferase family protein [Anaerolineaceae bacterium]
ILPQTIGPLTRKRDERLVRWILLRSRMVFIREEQSARQLQRVGIPPTRFHLVPDLAFTAPASPRSETDAILRQHGVDPQDRQPLLGVTLIDWGAQNRNFQHQERYEEAVYHAVRHFVDCHQGKAIFFAQVTGPTPADDDRIPAQRVARRLQTEGKAVAFVEEALPPAVLKSAYGSMDLFLGSRLHSTIFALSSGVPTIGIGYQPKTIGVFQMLGLEPWVFEIGDVDPERLSEKLDQLWQQRKDLAAVIENRIAQVQAESTQVADKIAKNYAAYVAEKAR